MKIFWSWQSDTDGKVGRHFVREALEAAIEDLREDLSLSEPVRGGLHLDHDRKGVSGSPDLVRTILDKIRESSILIADVTPVGETPEGKRLINSNVAIELGYAMAHIGDEAILMVFNSHMGTREDLPFDLRQKAGPIIFKLSAENDSEERRKIKRSLVGTLKVAIRDCLVSDKASRLNGDREREEKLEAERRAILDEVIARVDKMDEDNNGWLHLFAQPVRRTPNLVEAAESDSSGDLWDDLIMEAREAGSFLGHYNPDIQRAAPRPTVEGRTFYMSDRPERHQRKPKSVLDLSVGDTGWMDLHCGRAVVPGNRDEPEVLEVIVAGLVLKFCAFADGLYARAGYQGQVDLGVGITGIEGAEPYRAKRILNLVLEPPGFRQPQYLRTCRAEATVLASQPKNVARQLLRPFFRGLTQGHYDPLEDEAR